MSMSNQDFIELANVIRRGRWRIDLFKNGEVRELAEFCQSRNPNFNRKRWLDYIDGKCGPNGGKI